MPKRYKLEEMTPELVNRAEAWAFCWEDEDGKARQIIPSQDIRFNDEAGGNIVFQYNDYEYYAGDSAWMCPLSVQEIDLPE